MAKRKARNLGKQGRHSVETKIRAVKLYLEEGYKREQVAKKLGVGASTLTSWAKVYREQGEGGLAQERRGKRKGRTQVSAAAKRRAIELKRKNPEYGSRRISQMLRRLFFLKAGPETVRQTLKEKDLVKAPKKKRAKNPSRPRFFERARPNQLWQTDIFTFRLGGRAAYLIGYIDDYSRYIVGLGLYRSQTAEHVLEVYRRAIAEYGVPKEMLTDNGRQYTNWRGTTRFEYELKKDRVAHIKSRPHHPMTLGKIERLWKTIFTEFLSRVQFDHFEEAEERVRLWMKYYNHKRPHQGIGGLCPADRFYEIQTELRKVMERGIEENVLETALRGQPKKPFYMVGRMGDQSVVIQAEKGKVRMHVDDQESEKVEELVYDVQDNEKTDDGVEAEAAVQRADEMRGGSIGMVGAEETCGNMPGTGDQVGESESLAETGAGGDAHGPGAAGSEGGSTGAGVGSEAGEVAGTDGSAGPSVVEVGEEAGKDPDRWAEEDDEHFRKELKTHVALLEKDEVPIVLELLRESTAQRAEKMSDEQGAERQRRALESADDPESTSGGDERLGGSEAAGGEPQDVLQMGEEGAIGADGEPLRAELWPSGQERGYGEGGVEEADEGFEEGTVGESERAAITGPLVP
jgi:transposase InsO family protein